MDIINQFFEWIVGYLNLHFRFRFIQIQLGFNLVTQIFTTCHDKMVDVSVIFFIKMMTMKCKNGMLKNDSVSVQIVLILSYLQFQLRFKRLKKKCLFLEIQTRRILFFVFVKEWEITAHMVIMDTVKGKDQNHQWTLQDLRLFLVGLAQKRILHV